MMRAYLKEDKRVPSIPPPKDNLPRAWIISPDEEEMFKNMGSDKTKFVRQWPSEQELETKWEVVD